MPSNSSQQNVRISVVGFGLAGRRHAEVINDLQGMELHSIVDPLVNCDNFTPTYNVPHFSNYDKLLTVGKPDGIILATPSRLHVEQTLLCLAARIPTLVEKPLATDVAGARKLVEASRSFDVPLLVGHHRRFNPIVETAQQIMNNGELGSVVAVHGMFWLTKPDEYFAASWRSEHGAGPVMINLIHDVDLLRFLVGNVIEVQALISNATRNTSVEDTAVLIMRFECGALGTFTVSDTVVAPWSWELTAAENPVYAQTYQSCYFIGGTHGSLELPNLRLWSYTGKPSWWNSITATYFPTTTGDTFAKQIDHFAAVIRGEDSPRVSAIEGLKSLEIIEAILQSAQTEKTIKIVSQ